MLYDIVIELSIVLLIQPTADYLVSTSGIYESKRLSCQNKVFISVGFLLLPLLTMIYELLFSQSWIVIAIVVFCSVQRLSNFCSVKRLSNPTDPHNRFILPVVMLDDESWQNGCKILEFILSQFYSFAYTNRAVQLVEQSFRAESNKILSTALYHWIPVKDVNLIVCEYCAFANISRACANW